MLLGAAPCFGWVITVCHLDHNTCTCSHSRNPVQSARIPRTWAVRLAPAEITLPRRLPAPRAPAYSRILLEYSPRHDTSCNRVLPPPCWPTHPTGPQEADRYWPGVTPRGSSTVCVQPASFRTPPDSNHTRDGDTASKQ